MFREDGTYYLTDESIEKISSKILNNIHEGRKSSLNDLRSFSRAYAECDVTTHQTFEEIANTLCGKNSISVKTYLSYLRKDIESGDKSEFKKKVLDEFDFNEKLVEPFLKYLQISDEYKSFFEKNRKVEIRLMAASRLEGSLETYFLMKDLYK